MDPFDDFLPVAPASRARPGAKFAPKVKSKQPPRKEISEDRKNVNVASSPTRKNPEGISQNEFHNAVAVSTSTKELQYLEDATNSKMGNPQLVSVNRGIEALVDDPYFTNAASEVVADQSFTKFPKPLSEVDSIGHEVGSAIESIFETDLNNGTTQPVHPVNAVENKLNTEAAPCATCPTIGRMEEPRKNGEGSLLDSNKSLEVIDSSLQIGPNVGFKSTSDENDTAITENNVHSNFDLGKEGKILSAEFELDPFSSVLIDPCTRNARKFQPKVKPRPKPGRTPISASSSVFMEKSVELPTCTNEVQPCQSSGDVSGALNQSSGLPLPTSQILGTTEISNNSDYVNLSIPFSEEKRSLAAAIPSQPDSPTAIPSEALAHNGSRDWPSSFCKSVVETANIFSGLDSLDDFLPQAATGTGKPALSSIKSCGVCDTTQAQSCPEYDTIQDSLTFNEAGVVNEDVSHTNNSKSEAQEVAALNHDCLVDNIFEYQSLKSGTDPTSEISMHGDLTNSTDSPTLADSLHQDVTGEKEDANENNNSLRKRRRSSITGDDDKGSKTSRQLKKQAACKPAHNSLNEDVGDDDVLDPPYVSNRDELERSGEEYEVDYSSKKKRASTSSKKKSEAKNGKASRKRKKANDDLEKTTKEPPKKIPHATRRKKRCVDKTLLEVYEHNPQSLSLRDIISVGDYEERLKKEAATSKASSTIQSGGDFLHEDGANYEEEIYGSGANYEEEIFGPEYGRDPDDDEASERITSTASLINYGSYSNKAPKGKWSKQDTEQFYKALRQFGADFSMIQQFLHLVLPDNKKTVHQIKLKYKNEERKHRMQINDALSHREADHTGYKLLIEELQKSSTKAKLDPSRDASDFMQREEVEDLAPGTNEEEEAATDKQEEVATSKQDDNNVKDQEDTVPFNSPEQSDDSDNDLERWYNYKSEV